jgi:hypothetical protein
MKSEDEITGFTEQWYELITAGGHKDRDCHWYVKSRWSYGLPQVYVVVHDGGVFERVEEEFDTYEEALEGLKGYLERAISEEKAEREDDSDDDDEDDADDDGDEENL